MRKLRVIITLLCALGALYGAALPLPAGAAGLSPLTDCSLHGKLTRHYTASQLQAAIGSMSVDVKQYTNCPTVLNQALLADLGQHIGGGSGGGGGSFLPVWVIAVLVVALAAGAGAGAVALRNRRGAP